MSREIKFRGKRIDNGEWVVGYYYHSTINGRHYIADLMKTVSFEIDYTTLGQYTGLQNIFQGDICKDNSGNVIEIVWSDHHQWGCKIIKGGALSQGLTFPLWQYDKCKQNNNMSLTIIGKIHENNDLLTAGDRT